MSIFHITLMLIFSLQVSAKDFIRFYPNKNHPMENKSEVLLTISRDTIRLEGKMYAEHGFRVTWMDRDRPQGSGDLFIFIVSKDRHTGFYFGINPANVQMDGKIFDRFKLFPNWDEIWYSETKRWEDSLWTFKMQIPINIFKADIKNDTLCLYINFIRQAQLKEVGNYEIGSYVPILKGGLYQDLFYTNLIKIPLKKTKSYKSWMGSVIPYLSLLRENKQTKVKTGTDISLHFKDVEFSITVNPEYASIEADQDQFNLEKRRMIYLPEKRPFFVNGFELWELPFQVFYTRSLLDINLGFKLNYSEKNIKTNAFVVSEKDTLRNTSILNANQLTMGVRSVYELSFGNLGVFYILNRGNISGRGGDLTFELPEKLQLTLQYTRAGGKDIYLYFHRYSGSGITINSGFEYLEESLNLPTAFISYEPGTYSIWTYLGYNYTTERRYMNAVSLSMGGAEGKYIKDNKLYERQGSMYLGLSPCSRVWIEYNYTPEKRGDAISEAYFVNHLHFFATSIDLNDWQSLQAQYELGSYYGDYLNFYSISYALNREGKIQIKAGYSKSILRDQHEEDQLLWAKVKLRFHNKCYIKIFYQNSTISERKDLNLLLQFNFLPGGNAYLVYNYKDVQNETDHILMIKTSYVIKF